MWKIKRKLIYHDWSFERQMKTETDTNAENKNLE